MKIPLMRICTASGYTKFFLALAEGWRPLAPKNKSRNFNVQFLIADSYI